MKAEAPVKPEFVRPAPAYKDKVYMTGVGGIILAITIFAGGMLLLTYNQKIPVKVFSPALIATASAFGFVSIVSLAILGVNEYLTKRKSK